MLTFDRIFVSPSSHKNDELIEALGELNFPISLTRNPCRKGQIVKRVILGVPHRKSERAVRGERCVDSSKNHLFPTVRIVVNKAADKLYRSTITMPKVVCAWNRYALAR